MQSNHTNDAFLEGYSLLLHQLQIPFILVYLKRADCRAKNVHEAWHQVNTK